MAGKRELIDTGKHQRYVRHRQPSVAEVLAGAA
jgi:hypothetical protein